MKTLKTFRRIGRFLKKNWKWFAFSVGIISLILCLYWGITDNKQLRITKKKIDITKGLKEINSLEHKRDVLQSGKKDAREEIEGIDARLAIIQKDIIKRRAEVNVLTLAQKNDKFNKLGY